MFENKNKIAIVTGGGSGIGKAAAIALIQDGWSVAILGRRQALLESVLEESGAKSDEAIAIVCDVRISAQVKAAFSSVISQFGRLDLLFNNAGIHSRTAMIDEVTDQEWLDALEVNLTGAFFCAREAFAIMKNQEPAGGRIINNGSIAAHTPRPGTSPYTATKHAISGLTKSINLDGRAVNITCCQIDIGNVLTDMTVPMTKGMLQPDGEYKKEAVFSLPQVADAILYVANLPPEANVPSMTLMASQMPFVGRG